LSFDPLLLQLKNRIEVDTQKQSEYKIKLDLILESLKDDFGCDSLEEAIDYKKEIEDGKKDLQKLIESDIITLKNELNIE
jgi:hypothetical protein